MIVYTIFFKIGLWVDAHTKIEHKMTFFQCSKWCIKANLALKKWKRSAFDPTEYAGKLLYALGIGNKWQGQVLVQYTLFGTKQNKIQFSTSVKMTFQYKCNKFHYLKWQRITIQNTK